MSYRLRKLQFGRDCEVAEIDRIESVKSKAITQLQFGRDCEVAEIGESEPGKLRDRQCFNSAATVRSRKSGSARRAGASSEGFNSAATVRSRKCVPVPFGKYDEPSMLQFGRDCEVAEITPTRTPAIEPNGLQFGRDCEVAEICIGRSFRNEPLSASIRPRL